MSVVLTQNMEWASARSKRGRKLLSRAFAEDPSILCLTEAFENSVVKGYSISSDEDYGYALKPGRRKVILWSNAPWENVVTNVPQMPSGRIVSAETKLGSHPVKIIGVCIPWAQAHVSTGRKNANNWSEHEDWLKAFDKWLAPKLERTIILGDFNQRLPRRTQPHKVYSLMNEIIESRFEVVTQNLTDTDGHHTVDHIGITKDLISDKVFVVSRFDETGKRLSDHMSVGASIGAR